MNDLISRQAAIEAMMRLQKEDEEAYGVSIPEGFDGERAAEALSKLPSAEPERKTGRWEYHHYGSGCGNWHCTACGDIAIVSGIEAYCPNCGAKMEVEHETD